MTSSGVWSSTVVVPWSRWRWWPGLSGAWTSRSRTQRTSSSEEGERRVKGEDFKLLLNCNIWTLVNVCLQINKNYLQNAEGFCATTKTTTCEVVYIKTQKYKNKARMSTSPRRGPRLTSDVLRHGFWRGALRKSEWR